MRGGLYQAKDDLNSTLEAIRFLHPRSSTSSLLDAPPPYSKSDRIVSERSPLSTFLEAQRSRESQREAMKEFQVDGSTLSLALFTDVTNSKTSGGSGPPRRTSDSVTVPSSLLAMNPDKRLGQRTSRAQASESQLHPRFRHGCSLFRVHPGLRPEIPDSITGSHRYYAPVDICGACLTTRHQLTKLISTEDKIRLSS